jgi:hypothetical protein
VSGIGEVDGAVELGHPDRDPVGVQVGDDVLGLPAVEGPLELADHDRVERAVGAGGGGQHGGGLGALLPGHGTGVSDVEKLGGDPAVSTDQLAGAVQLPLPRRRWVLEPAGGGPPIEREP